MGAINTLSFIEGGSRFVSTSDDKKIFLWEFGIPVVAKHLNEPDMSSIVSSAVHPDGSFWIGQSMDDKIVVYDCKGFK
jgi:pre-mRNA-processing factor 17